MPKKESALHIARLLKNDEFYTKIEYIEDELDNYKEVLKGKKIHLNCDDYRKSKFFTYLEERFEELELEAVVATHYVDQRYSILNGEEIPEKPKKAVLTKEGLHVEDLKGDGDFRSEEVIEITKQCDVVITNPPFSLFSDLIKIMKRHKKDFILMGTLLKIAIKDVEQMASEGNLELGFNHKIHMPFTTPSGEDVKVPNITWFTSFTIDKGRTILRNNFNKKDLYLRDENTGEVNIDSLSELPLGYEGVILVPINFMEYYNKDEFIIHPPSIKRHGVIVEGKGKFSRLAVQMKPLFKKKLIEEGILTGEEKFNIKDLEIDKGLLFLTGGD